MPVSCTPYDPVKIRNFGVYTLPLQCAVAQPRISSGYRLIGIFSKGKLKHVIDVTHPSVFRECYDRHCMDRSEMELYMVKIEHLNLCFMDNQ
jgi:hypothetical protein